MVPIRGGGCKQNFNWKRLRKGVLGLYKFVYFCAQKFLSIVSTDRISSFMFKDMVISLSHRQYILLSVVHVDKMWLKHHLYE